jgi:hypothetical protein
VFLAELLLVVRARRGRRLAISRPRSRSPAPRVPGLLRQPAVLADSGAEPLGILFENVLPSTSRSPDRLADGDDRLQSDGRSCRCSAWRQPQPRRAPFAEIALGRPLALHRRIATGRTRSAAA